VTSLPGVAVAEPVRAGTSEDEWILNVSLEAPALVTLQGASWAERGPVRTMFDGLLFDREALASSVRASPSESTDADLVLAAYEQWGEAALVRLRGHFAVGIVDRRLNQTIVARDQLGMHPLFYASVGGSIVFAPAPRLLFAHAGDPNTVNRLALADHLCQRWPQPDETFFQCVRRVTPGARALITRQQFRVDRYWDPSPEDRPAEWLTDEEANRFDERLDHAVDRCLGTGRTAIFLSGGLDSISVAAVSSDWARRTGRERPAALSLAFPDPECDERLVQTAVARKLGLSHRLLGFHDAVGPRGLLAEALDLNRGLSSPVLNTWEPAYLALVREGRVNGVETILTGYGGDEWLSVSPYLSADLIRRGDLSGLARFLGVWQRSYNYSAPRLLYSALWRFGLRPLGSQMLQRVMPGPWEKSRVRRSLSADPSWVAPDATLRSEQSERAKAFLATADPADGFYWREVRLGILNALTSWELEEQYEFGRRAGVRFMHPYWDADLVHMLYRMRPERLMRDGRSKGLVRDTVARRFPGLGFDRQRKVAATSFYRTILRTEGPSVARRLGDVEALAGLGVVDGRATRTFLRDAPASGGKDLYRMWQLLNLESWVRQHVN
jgi:asparagine synthetase B (glutamine-hydrolysing)